MSGTNRTLRLWLPYNPACATRFFKEKIRKEKMAKYNLALHLQHIDADDVPTKEELQQYADEFVKNFTSYDPKIAGWDRAHVRVPFYFPLSLI